MSGDPPPRRVAALDLGSNSAKLLVVEARPGDPPARVHETERVTRISEGVQRTGRLDPAAEARTSAALEELLEIARAHGAQRIGAVATAGLRGARGAERFVARLERELGLHLEIIDGDAEAGLAFRSTDAGEPAPRWVLDVGGRSTELAYGAGPEPERRASLETGGVRLAERFRPRDPPTPAEMSAIADHLREVFSAIPASSPPSPGARVIGVSGTVLAALGVEIGERDLARVLERAPGAWLERAAIARLRSRLAALPARDRVFGTTLPPGRADVVPFGLAIVEAALDALGAPGLEVHPGGVGLGLALSLFDEARADTPRSGPAPTA